MAGASRISKTTTTHPRTGSRLRIDEETYTLFRRAILQSLRGRSGKTFSELTDAVKKIIQKRRPGFKGSVQWYTITVRLDLETRGEVETFILKGKKLNRVRL